MNIKVCDSKKELGHASGFAAAELLRKAIAEKGKANLIVATGASQFDTLASLSAEKGIDWTRVTMFHLDEYVGLPESHPASFRKYLKERFVAKLPALLAMANFVNGDFADPHAECARLGELIKKHPIDVALVGIGENGHLAFNDPPADFNTEEPYIVVKLDDKCRQQQLGEGWFPNFDAVPSRAISMSIRQIMKSKAIICTVPDSRKAEAVKNTIEGALSNLCPASVLRMHPHCELFLDRPATSELSWKI